MSRLSAQLAGHGRRWQSVWHEIALEQYEEGVEQDVKTVTGIEALAGNGLAHGNHERTAAGGAQAFVSWAMMGADERSDEKSDEPAAQAGSHGLVAHVDGKPYVHGALLLLLATLAAGASDSDRASRERGGAALNALLAAARESGFAQCDILRTLLARGDFSERTIVLARTAMQGVSAAQLAAHLRGTGVSRA